MSSLKRLAFDLESDGLLPELTKIHCLAVRNIDTDEAEVFNGSNIVDALKLLDTADEIWAHNGINFDVPALYKVYRWMPKAKVRDTMIMSRMLWSNLNDLDHSKKLKLPLRLHGSHALKAWGIRLDEHKGDYNGGWSYWSQEMEDYCIQDVVVTVKLIKLIDAKETSKEAVELSHKLAEVCQQIETNGWKFDENKANKLLTTLTEKREQIRASLSGLFDDWYTFQEVHEPKVNNSKRGITKGCQYSKVKLNQFNPASRSHIANRLISKYSWKPKVFTEKGGVKVDETVLSTLQYPEAKQLSEFFLLDKRIGMLSEGRQAWLKKVYGGMLHHSIIVNSCVSQRASHRNPNLAQIPAVRAPYGKECRDLFTVRPGFKLVGADYAGLELRMLAHYMAKFDGGKFAKEVVEGDIHTTNSNLLGISRDESKRFIYATIYSAGPAKLGEIVGGGVKEGAALRARFYQQYPAYKTLLNQVQKTAERGYLLGIDGRRLQVRSLHSALNLLIQSAGAILCSKWLVLFDEKMRADGLIPGWKNDYAITAWVHDEIQVATKEGIENDTGNRLKEMAKEAGRQLKVRSKVEADFTVGTSWANTH